MFRRALLAACTIVLLSAAPAAAQSYGDIGGAGQPRVPTVVAGGEGPVGAVDSGLARTGSNDTVPLVEAGIVMIGGGALLALVARRRRSERSSTTA